MSRRLLTTVATFAIPGSLRTPSVPLLDVLENRFEVWNACSLQKGRLQTRERLDSSARRTAALLAIATDIVIILLVLPVRQL